MSKLCIYHSADLDGWVSAAIVKHYYSLKNENDIVFIGWDYGDSIPDYSQYSEVIMCDVSFSKEVMEDINNNHFLVWIDHHISAINKMDDVELVGKRDTKYSACELTWKYFFSHDTMPEIVRLIGRYDCFGHIGTNEEQKVLEFQYGARAYIYNYETAYYLLLVNMAESSMLVESNNTKLFEIIHNAGKNIVLYLKVQAREVYNNGFPIIFKEDNIKRKFICFNAERFNPMNFDIDYHADGYDGVASFYLMQGENPAWKFSLYNSNGKVDCTKIAKKYGGGGHKGASGFILNKKDFNKLIKM